VLPPFRYGCPFPPIEFRLITALRVPFEVKQIELERWAPALLQSTRPHCLSDSRRQANDAQLEATSARPNRSCLWPQKANYTRYT
jgi:hypothetical protein